MSIMINANFLEALTQDMYDWAFESYTAEPVVWPQLCEIKSLDTGDGWKGTSTYGLDVLDDVPDEQEAKASEFGEAYTWRIRIKNFRKKFVVTENLLNDTNKDKLAADLQGLAQQWGQMVRLTEENSVARLFNKGPLTAGDKTAFDNSYTNEPDPNAGFIYDGLPWFDTAHPSYLDATATYANHTASLSFSATNLQTVYTAMTVTNAKNERGQEIQIVPDVILANPALKWTIDPILKSQYGVDANMTLNVVQGIADPIYWRLLSDADGWYVGLKKKGIQFYDRQPMRITITQIPGKNAFEVEVKRRFGVGITNWRYWYCANVAAS